MNIASAVQPKQPINPAWRPLNARMNTGYPQQGWFHPALSIVVISAVEVAEQHIGPEFHISISKNTSGAPRRCSAEEARMVLKQFGADAAEEDNHSSLIRNFWLPVNSSLIGIQCECKDQEAAVREGDFEWRPLTKENYESAKVKS